MVFLILRKRKQHSFQFSYVNYLIYKKELCFVFKSPQSLTYSQVVTWHIKTIVGWHRSGNCSKSLYCGPFNTNWTEEIEADERTVEYLTLFSSTPHSQLSSNCSPGGPAFLKPHAWHRNKDAPPLYKLWYGNIAVPPLPQVYKSLR